MPSQTTKAHCFRFSLRQLFFATAIVAIGCYPLRYASPWWATVVFYGGILLLVVAGLIGINCRKASRSFWLGFLFFGLAHLVARTSIALPKASESIGRQRFATEQVSAKVYDWLKPSLTVQPVMYP